MDVLKKSFAGEINFSAHNTENTALSENHSGIVGYKAIEEHLCCELNGEAVILSLDNGNYYGVNSVGARIWELLRTEITFDGLEEKILSEYAVPPEECRREVEAFLKMMAAEGLIKTVYATD